MAARVRQSASGACVARARFVHIQNPCAPPDEKSGFVSASKASCQSHDHALPSALARRASSSAGRELLLDAPPVQQPGQRFHSDITYIPTGEGWLYTAATLDGYSRKCAGWSADDNMETSLVLRAAQRAFADASADAAVHHSDRGSQYASEGFRNFLSDCDIVQSMSRRGNCYDNALMESFWATLKTECFDNFRSGIPQTRQQAKQQLFAYIEVFYNRKRLHSSLGYISPEAFEAGLN